MLNQVKLIAEPWDCGPGGYQVGAFPPGWAEWNDRYRDTVRAYWRGDDGKVPATSPRGSPAPPDLFNQRGRKPWASVNFVTAHDGFTLNDLVSYNDKHNEANGEDNRDGNSNNLSCNYGVEGPTDDPDDPARCASGRSATCWPPCSCRRARPMILAGDEFGHTQRGNNNAYCQDNEISWLEWDAIGDEGRALIAFVRKLTCLRHAFPILRRGRFLTAAVERGAAGQGRHVDQRGRLRDGAGRSGTIRTCAASGCCSTGARAGERDQAAGGGRDPAAGHERVPRRGEVHPAALVGGSRWLCMLDTNQPERSDTPSFDVGQTYAVTARSFLLFAGLTTGSPGRAVRASLSSSPPAPRATNAGSGLTFRHFSATSRVRRAHENVGM